MKKFPNSVLWDKTHRTKTFRGKKGTALSVFTTGLRLQARGKQNPRLAYIHFETIRRIVGRVIKPRVKRSRRARFAKKMQRKLTASKKKKGRRRSKTRKNPVRLRYHFYLPVTKKPLQVRMGKGKGNPYNWVYPASSSRVLLELSRKYLTYKKIQKCAVKSSRNISYKTKLFFERRFMRREHRYKIHPPFYHKDYFKKHLRIDSKHE